MYEEFINKLEAYGTESGSSDSLGKEIIGTNQLLVDAACVIKTLVRMYTRSEIDCQNYLGELAKVSVELEQVKRERDAAIKDIELYLKGLAEHGCEMCLYYKDCTRNDVLNAIDSKNH